MANTREKKHKEAPHQAPKKSVVNTLVDGAIRAGISMVSLMSSLLAAVLILYSSYVLYDTFAVEQAASSSAWDIVQYKPSVDDETPSQYVPGLETVNPDYRAWLTVYDTSIDYPIMQAEDDLYYASHDIYKHSSLTGAIYLAAANSPDFSDSYNVVFGHHMDNGAMFGKLDDFLDEGFFDSHRAGIVVTPIGAYDIDFFAVASTDAYEDHIYTVDHGKDSVISFLASGGEGGSGLGTTVHYFDAAAAADADKVIALSTCASGDGTSGRLVVFGKMSEHIAYKDLTVKKVWDDADNQDGMRPDSLRVTLSNGEYVILNDENNWTKTIEHVPVNQNWTVIEYSWEEDACDGYIQTGYVEEDNVTTITNCHTPETVSISVSKVWDDDENRDGIRPQSLSVYLHADNTVLKAFSLNESNFWSATMNNLPVYAYGQKISYTWTEEEITGYASESRSDGHLTVITNKHTPATTSLSVRKRWDDADNQDGIRPISVLATLSANGKPIKSVTLTQENAWIEDIDDLPVYEAGQPIEYAWIENPVSGYDSEVKTSGDSTVIKNTHIPETQTIIVRKVWDDDRNRDGMRPDTLRVHLSNGMDFTLCADDGWTLEVEDLPVYKNGERIVYTWAEDPVDGYELVSNLTNNNTTVLTNYHKTETTVSTVIKVWDDDNDRDGVRPQSVYVMLSNGMKAILNEDNHWITTVEGLPFYENGIPVEYTWTEDTVAEYKASYDAQGTITTITNKHAPKTTDLTIEKEWDDANNQDGVRPSKIHAVLSNGTRVELSAENRWTATVAGLYMYENGQPIEYSWTEEPVDGYEDWFSTTNNHTLVINTHDPEKISLSVCKVWDDDGNRDGVRPSKLTVHLLGNSENVADVVLSEDGGWKGNVSDLPKFADGKPIVYSWLEEDIDGYELTDVQTNESLTLLTNKHTLSTQTLHVNKVWADGDDRDGIRPASVSITLKANGRTVFTGTLSEKNQWSSSVSNLPVYENGNRINYKWSEADVEGYETAIESNGKNTTITNTHDFATTSRTVKKVWDDNDDQDALRPSSLTVTLMANGTPVQSVVLSEDNNWTQTITDLPLNEKGIHIVYTWTEETVNGYKLITQTTDDTTTVLTNGHSQELLSLSVRKLWADYADRDGMRPDSLEVYLMQDNDVAGKVTLTPNNTWTASITGLPKYEQGREIVYTWVEPSVYGYERGSVELEGNRTTITNKLLEKEPDDHEYTLTIYYLYINGETAAPTVIEIHRAGDKYDVVSPVIPGYTASILKVQGIMPSRDVEYTVIYTPTDEHQAIEDIETPLGMGAIHINVGDCLD